MARWVKLPVILVRRARGWSAAEIEQPDARNKLDHVTRVALGRISRRDRRALTAIGPSAEHRSHDGSGTPSDSARP